MILGLLVAGFLLVVAAATAVSAALARRDTVGRLREGAT
jgi:hypothetical protein